MTTRRRRVGAPAGGTTERGYGTAHQRARKNALAEFVPGVTVCARGGEIMHATDLPELDHTDDRTGYLGLSCRRHNRGARPDAPPAEPTSEHGFGRDGAWNPTSCDW